jgi:hypothetical protein
MKENLAGAVSYLIGVALIIPAIIMLKRKKELPEKKLFGFPLIKVFYVLIAYLVCMAILAYFGVR